MPLGYQHVVPNELLRPFIQRGIVQGLALSFGDRDSQTFVAHFAPAFFFSFAAAFGSSLAQPFSSTGSDSWAGSGRAWISLRSSEARSDGTWDRGPSTECSKSH